MSPKNKTLIFDIEATGLLRQEPRSQIHCIVVRDVDNPDETLVFDHRPEHSIEMGVELLLRADTLINHNLLGYDIPLIQESYDFDFKGQVIDTLIMSRLYFPEDVITERDYERRPTDMPLSLYGRHSLDAWGYRLKVLKGDYGKKPGAWKIYTPEMLDYCKQDTLVTLELFNLLMRRMERFS